MLPNTRSTIDFVTSQIPGLNYRLEEEDPFERLVLPTHSTSDYGFVLWFYPEGDFQICAKRCEARADDEYFWYMPFEMPDYGSDEGALRAFHAVILRLATRPSRIIQLKHLFTWTFRCEVLEEGTWRRVYYHGGFRWMSGAPKIVGSKHTFTAPAPCLRVNP